MISNRPSLLRSALIVFIAYSSKRNDWAMTDTIKVRTNSQIFRNFRGQSVNNDREQVDSTLQNRITRIPFFIRNLIKFDTSVREDFLPRDGFLGSTRAGFQIRYSLLPEGAPSLETTSILLESSPNIFDMYSDGLANVALHDTKRMHLSEK